MPLHGTADLCALAPLVEACDGDGGGPGAARRPPGRVVVGALPPGAGSTLEEGLGLSVRPSQGEVCSKVGKSGQHHIL